MNISLKTTIPECVADGIGATTENTQLPIAGPPAMMECRAYLNNAATAYPKAPGVSRTVQMWLNNIPESTGRQAFSPCDVLAECRRQLASLLGCDDPDRIALMSGATHALNCAIFGLPLKAGDHVVTSVTEHNSVLRPLNHLRRRLGIRVTVVGLDDTGALDPAAMERALREEPVLLVLNHASNVTGRINDVRVWFRRAHECGATTLLDASQTLGTIPVTPETLAADMVAFTGHKALLGPEGTGGLYVRPGLDLEPLLVGGTGVRSDLAYQPDDMPARLEAGTPNTPAIAGLLAALMWLQQKGELFHRREQRSIRWLRRQLAEIPGVHVYDHQPDVPRVGIVSFRMNGWSVEEAGYVLRESFGICSRTGLHCAPLIHEAIGSMPEGTMRFSVSGFTSDSEIEEAVSAVRRLAG